MCSAVSFNMLKSRPGFSILKSVVLFVLFFCITYYAIFYRGREEKLISDLFGKKDVAVESEPISTSGKQIVPPGTELAPAAIIIKPKIDKKFNRSIVAALELLWDAGEETYKFVSNNINEIRHENKTGFYKDTEAYVAALSDANAFYSNTWTAGILTHQACHAWYYKQKRKKKNTINVPLPDKTETGKYEMNPLMKDITTLDDVFKVEERCAKYQAQVLVRIGAPSSEVNFVLNRKPRDFSYAHDGNFVL